MERLNTLRAKLDLLLRDYKSLKDDLATTRASLEEKQEEIALMRTQMAKYEEQLLALQIGNAIPDAEGRANARKQLDAVIGEIDKILTTLPLCVFYWL
jgi:hypothetical protein